MLPYNYDIGWYGWVDHKSQIEHFTHCGSCMWWGIPAPKMLCPWIKYFGSITCLAFLFWIAYKFSWNIKKPKYGIFLLTPPPLTTTHGNGGGVNFKKECYWGLEMYKESRICIIFFGHLYGGYYLFWEMFLKHVNNINYANFWFTSTLVPWDGTLWGCREWIYQGIHLWLLATKKSSLNIIISYIWHHLIRLIYPFHISDFVWFSNINYNLYYLGNFLSHVSYSHFGSVLSKFVNM